MDQPSLKTQTVQKIQQNYTENLQTLYRQIYFTLLIMLSFAAYAAAIRYFYYFQGRQAGFLVCLVVGLAISIPLGKRYLRPATWVLLFAAWLGLAVETIASPLGPAKFCFVFVAAMAALTLSSKTLLSTGAASAVFLLGAGYQAAEPVSFLQAALLTITLTVILFFGIRLLLLSLQQATQYVYLANNAMEEARTDRGRLVQTVKALDEGNYRLEKAYQKIALARDEANQAREMKIQFANMISHELRAPLNFIIGVTDLMVRSPELYGQEAWPPELQEDVARLYELSKHLSNLINDVLTLGQIEANRVALRFELSSIVDVIKDVLVIIRPSYEHRDLYLNLEVDPSIPLLQLDRVRIRQVVLNLLNNAYRFVRSGGVTIRVRQDQAVVVVSVEDTGIGIPADQIPRLFQEFFQISDANAQSDSTSGLGLSISQQFIKLHGGHIWVESPVQSGSSTNPGTRFSFSLPIHMTEPLVRNEEREQRFWRLQNEHAHKNRSVVVFTELAVDDLLTSSSFSSYHLIVLSDREQLAEKVFGLQPNAFIEITAGSVSLLSQNTRNLLMQENIPYLHCQVEQEDTGVEPLWDEYLMKPFTIDQVREIVTEVCPGAANFMVVDDDVNMLRYFELGLSALNHTQVELVQASTGKEALLLLERALPDILFLDINLPDADGLELLQQLKQDGRYKALPVVIISALNKPYLYNTRVLRIEYIPGQSLDREGFVMEMEGFLNSIRFNTSA